MPDRSARMKQRVLMASLIAVGCLLVIAMLTAGGMYVWAQFVPPLEAEPTTVGLRVQVNRAMLRDVRISVDGGPPVALAELPRGVTVLPWSDFGLVASQTVHDEVREVQATGMSKFSRFQTTLSFTSFPDGNSATAQTLNYVSTAE